MFLFTRERTPLHDAAKHGNVDACKALLSANADSAARGGCAVTITPPAAAWGHHLRHNLGNIVHYWISITAHRENDTPLKYAIANSNADVVAFLRSVGAPE
jgi:ankyrin repeat protein